MTDLRAVGIALIAAGVSTGVGALVALHALPTGLSPVRSPVSQYGITTYRTGYRIQTIAYGVAGIGAAIGVAALPGPSGAVVVASGLFAAGRLAISWFPMDAPDAGPTATGRRHGALALTAFVAIAVAATQLRTLLHHDRLHPAVATASGALAGLMLLAFLAMMVDRRTGGRYFGLVERGFYACMTAWLVLVAALLAVQL